MPTTKTRRGDMIAPFGLVISKSVPGRHNAVKVTTWGLGTPVTQAVVRLWSPWLQVTGASRCNPPPSSQIKLLHTKLLHCEHLNLLLHLAPVTITVPNRHHRHLEIGFLVNYAPRLQPIRVLGGHGVMQDTPQSVQCSGPRHITSEAHTPPTPSLGSHPSAAGSLPHL